MQLPQLPACNTYVSLHAPQLLLHLLASSSSLSRFLTETGVTRADVGLPCLTGTKFSFAVSHSTSSDILLACLPTAAAAAAASGLKEDSVRYLCHQHASCQLQATLLPPPK